MVCAIYWTPACDAESETTEMNTIAVLDDFQGRAVEFADWSSLDGKVEFFRNHVTGDDLVVALQGYDVVVAMRERTAFPRDVLERLGDLRLLITTGASNASIDVAAANEHGIVVCGTRGTATQVSTTELGWALLLGAVKHLPLEDRSMRQGKWQVSLSGDLFGRRLGLVGLGRLGEAMVPIAKAFSMDIVAWSQNLTAEPRPRSASARCATKEELLETSDVVSIHLRLSDRTHWSCSERATSPGCGEEHSCSNTSRGPIVDEAALVEALALGRHPCGTLTSTTSNRCAADHPFLTLDNVVLSPHLGCRERGQHFHLFYAMTSSRTSRPSQPAHPGARGGTLGGSSLPASPQSGEEVRPFCLVIVSDRSRAWRRRSPGAAASGTPARSTGSANEAGDLPGRHGEGDRDQRESDVDESERDPADCGRRPSVPRISTTQTHTVQSEKARSTREGRKRRTSSLDTNKRPVRSTWRAGSPLKNDKRSDCTNPRRESPTASATAADAALIEDVFVGHLISNHPRQQRVLRSRPVAERGPGLTVLRLGHRPLSPGYRSHHAGLQTDAGHAPAVGLVASRSRSPG